MKQDTEQVIIYTDGGCEPNPGVGGWAAVLTCKGRTKELFGGESQTTNNRMEMLAAIRALEALKRPCRVLLHTDSEYLRLGVTEWMPNWKKRQWKRKGGPLKNDDLWRQLDVLTERHEVSWKWVPGHAGIPLNERCDQLAQEAIRRQRLTSKKPNNDFWG